MAYTLADRVLTPPSQEVKVLNVKEACPMRTALALRTLHMCLAACLHLHVSLYLRVAHCVFTAVGEQQRSASCKQTQQLLKP